MFQLQYCSEHTQCTVYQIVIEYQDVDSQLSSKGKRVWFTLLNERPPEESVLAYTQLRKYCSNMIGSILQTARMHCYFPA